MTDPHSTVPRRLVGWLLALGLVVGAAFGDDPRKSLTRSGWVNLPAASAQRGAYELYATVNNGYGLSLQVDRLTMNGAYAVIIAVNSMPIIVPTVNNVLHLTQKQIDGFGNQDIVITFVAPNLNRLDVQISKDPRRNLLLVSTR